MREGVQDRVAIVSGDARRLPFPSNRFDVVLSSLLIHNIKGREEREAALGEIVRVLKPSGRVALLDFQNTAHYADVLAKSGPLREVGRSRVDFRMYPPVRTVTATKAPSGNS